MIRTAGPIAKRLLAIDARSLALLRIGVAMVILLDLFCMRLPDVQAFYTGDSMVPVALSQGTAAQPAHWSLHELRSDPAFQTGMLYVSGVAAALLLAGCLTRGVTVVCWVLVASLANRNPLVINYGDSILQLLLFWAMFVPWGETWSVDAWWRAGRPQPRSERREVVSVATGCLLLQLCLVYLFGGLWKLNDDWLHGTAITHALQLEYAVRRSAEYLQQYSALLPWLTQATLLLELSGPILVWSPWRTSALRMTMVVAFLLLHVGIELFFTPLYLSHICIVAWSMFIPGSFWEVAGIRRLTQWWELWMQARRGNRLPQQAAPSCPVCYAGRRAVDLQLAALMGYVVLWNVATFDAQRLGFLLPERARWFGHVALLRQTWDMFWVPSRFNGWIEVRAELADGTTIDLLGNERRVPSQPMRPNWSDMPNSRWKVFFRRLSENPDPEVCQRVLDYHWRVWNRDHTDDRRAIRMDVVFIRWQGNSMTESRAFAERVVCRVESPEANSVEAMLRRLMDFDEGYEIRK